MGGFPPIVTVENPPADSGWADGRLLIVTPRTVLPPVCVKCGRTTLEPPTKRLVTWRPPWVYLLLLLGLLPFVIAAAITAKSMKVQFPLCASHKEHYRTLRIVGAILGLGAIPEIIVATAYLPESSQTMGILAGIAALFAGIVCLALAGSILRSKFIDHNYAYLKNANPSFLSLLPPRPPNVPAR